MRIDKDGRCHLVEGEIIPVRCVTCLEFYQPEKNSLASRCRHCGHFNLHWELQAHFVLHKRQTEGEGAWRRPSESAGMER